MSSKAKTTGTKKDGKPVLVPKLRFPEFRGAKGWTKVRLIDTADRSVKWSFIGGPFGSNLKSSDYVADGVRIIQLQNIGDGEFFDAYRIFTTPEKADELLSNNIYPGEIIMSKMGDPVGRACLIPEGHDRYVMCSDGIRLVVDEKAHDKYFIYSLINSPPFRETVEKTATGSTRKRIGLDELKNLPMRLPQKGEQQKIAECLSSVDEVIAAQARKVDALKTHKKGLMQQLFPREGETHPRLRFPEFKAGGEWEERKLGGVCDIQRGKFSHRPRNEPRFFGGQYPFIQTGDVVRSEGGAVIASQSLNEEGLAVSKLFKPTIVLITIAANIGDTGLLQTEGCFTDSVVGLIPKKDVIPVFLELIMRGQKEYLNKVATTGAQKNINNEILREVSLLLPRVPEQRRIADCLSSLDALITAETQKLEALKLQKRGLMQQLFASLEEVEA